MNDTNASGERKMILRMYLVVLIFVVCVYGQEVRIEHDFMKAAQRITEFSDAKTKTNYQYPVSSLLQDSHNDVIARAEELLKDFPRAPDPRFNVSSLCLNHTRTLLTAIIARQPWALRMIDAMGKPPSGLAEYRYVWLGDYDECVETEATVNRSGVIIPLFKGRYCKAAFKIAKATPNPLNPRGEVDLTVGVCVPNSCNEQDTHLLNALLNTTAVSPPKAVVCQYDKLEYTTKAIVVMVICSIFAIVMITATAYDIIVIQWLGSRATELSKYEVLPENYEPLTKHNVGNNYGATEAVTSLPVNARFEQNGILPNENIREVDIRPSVQEPHPPGTLVRVLLSFSVYTNASKILNVNQPSGTLTAVNGIRFISMTWVILGHTYVFGLTAADNLLPFLLKMFKRFTFQAISNATVSVDTFFTLSGLLVSYLCLKEMKKRDGARKFQWGMFYFHRFWRLTPPYMLFLMFYVPLIKYWSNGPLWSQKGIDLEECENTWWKNLLYINNLVDPMKMIISGSYSFHPSEKKFTVERLSCCSANTILSSSLLGGLSCIAFVLVNFISTGVISARDHLSPSLTGGQNGFADIYVKPWCRIGPYAVGFLAGYILYKTDCKIRMPKLVNLLGWAVATSIALLVLYGLYDSSGMPHLSNNVSALYNATNRSAWALAVCWVIIACATGHGGWVNTFLSWKPFVPLSRLTYCAYLVHPVVMDVYYMSRRTLVFYSDLEVVYLFCGHLCLSYAAAFIVSLAFESPMMGLEKVLLGRGKNS